MRVWGKGFSAHYIYIYIDFGLLYPKFVHTVVLSPVTCDRLVDEQAPNGLCHLPLLTHLSKYTQMYLLRIFVLVFTPLSSHF